MDIRIGISESNHVIEVEMADETDRAALKSSISNSISEGTMLWLIDKRGKETGIPGAKVAFADIGSAEDDRRIGFGA